MAGYVYAECECFANVIVDYRRAHCAGGVIVWGGIGLSCRSSKGHECSLMPGWGPVSHYCALCPSAWWHFSARPCCPQVFVQVLWKLKTSRQASINVIHCMWRRCNALQIAFGGYTERKLCNTWSVFSVFLLCLSLFVAGIPVLFIFMYIHILWTVYVC